MVLTKQNSGLYLTKEWNDPDRERQRCLHDSRNFTTAEKALYEVHDTGIRDGLGYELDNAMAIQTTPVDTRTPARPMDQRDKPEVGY